jgi:formiminotetrahydrofolate cyclodeaminase
MLLDRSCRELLDAFSAPDPTPGGGSASALAGALGAALLAMVAGLPKTRHGGGEDRAALDEVRPRLLAARARLAALVEEDAAAYDRVVAAYRLPKGTDAERRARSEAIQRALRRAIETPLAVMQHAAAGAEAAEVVARHGSAAASSDVGVALELLGAALRGARLNVEVNLATVDDAAYVARIRGETDEWTGAFDRAADRARAALA